MNFLHRIHSPALAARLSETHKRIFFFARTERSSPLREDEDETQHKVADDEEDHRG